MAASLLARIQLDWKNRWGIAEPGHELLSQLQRCAKPGVAKWLEKYVVVTNRAWSTNHRQSMVSRTMEPFRQMQSVANPCIFL